jgi:hypothetical protein
MRSDKLALMQYMMMKRQRIKKYLDSGMQPRERFHQESVLVTEDKIEGRFLYGKEKSDV